MHGDLAESAYKAQASEVMRSGPMTEEKAAYLEDMRGQVSRCLAVRLAVSERVMGGI